MSRFENMNILESSRSRGPKFVSEEVLTKVEDIINERMFPLDLEDIGENLGYSTEEIEKDMTYVKNTMNNIDHGNLLDRNMRDRRAQINGQNNKDNSRYYERLGHAFEGFLYSNISESRIFKDVILHKTSQFDDIKNGVDFIAEYKNPDDPNSYIALAMDASFSMSPELINKKIDRSLGKISRQQLSKVKYFQFEEGSDESRLGMPRVVVGTDKDRVRHLLTRWERKENYEGSVVSFEDDPVWTLVALQINEQLKMFIEEAQSYNQTELVSICEKYQRALDISLRLNKDLVEKHRVLIDQDGTSMVINSYCYKAKKERLINEKLRKEVKQARYDNKSDDDFHRAIRA